MNVIIENGQMIISFNKDTKFKLPPTCIIKSGYEFWNGYKWTNIETHLQMDNVADNMFVYTIANDNFRNYEISIFDEFNSIKIETQNIIATEEQPTTPFDPSEVLIITNKTLKQSNGEDTTIMDEDNKYLKGVSVIAVNKETLQEKETLTDENGEWKLRLNHGDYVFIFSLDNYGQISIERSI